ncbi:M56 family metallopeptidase [Massilibacteroides sp.]|uniref:M56 family metallopeptidase n=1 Tax=Massilibacteroides sp. TaxID=2034766 RepID=UPI002630D51C|nr:M56 family metallopeptidase [Massilibacteroides sp.]MDD4516649.1 M56 family metallopeptidase [Massilibacteroides sp.]
MSVFLLYIIRSTCCLVLFYTGYKLLLSKDTFFAFNRKVLLFGTIACILLPLVEIKTEDPSVIQKTFVELDMLFTQDVVSLSQKEGNEDFAIQPTNTIEKTISSGLLLSSIYLLGLSVVVLLSFNSFLSLSLFLRKGKRVKKKDYILVLTDKNIAPFTWWRYIVMPENDYQDSYDEVIAHELAHLRKKHSLDLLFFEFVLLFHWFTPVIWLLKRELRNVHEFEADSEVVTNGIDATKYQLLLLRKAVGSSSYTFTNSLNQCKLKTRITMMLKRQSKRQARWKLALFVPMAAFAMYAFARPEISGQLQQLIPDEDTTISGNEQSYSCEPFDSEFDAYYRKVYGDDSLSMYEKFDRLKERSFTTALFLNSKDEILFSQDRIKIEQFASKLKTAISEATKVNKPLLVYFLYDRGTSTSMVAQITKTLNDVIHHYKEKAEFAEKPVLVYFGNTHDYNKNKETVSDILIKIYDKDNKSYTVVINPYDTMGEIREKLNLLSTKTVLSLGIKAGPGTPMGIITDIKQVIREIYTLTQTDVEGPGYITIQQTKISG